MNEKLKNFLKKFIKVEAYEKSKWYYMLRYSLGPIKYERYHCPKLKKLNNYYKQNSKVYLSIACISKDEGPYIKEWIEYHKIVGVERFYFYDNESTDNTREVLEPYIKDGTVVYNYIEGRCLQNLAYADAIVKYKNQTRWLAIIDLDEYIVSTSTDTIPQFLKAYEKYPAVGINWVLFDSNGHKTKPTAEGGLITANYVRTRKNYIGNYNLNIKSIVNPRKVVGIYNPHYAVYKNNRFAVNENYEEVYGPNTEYHSVNKIRINHYYSKSEEEYVKKTKRGNADSNNEREYVEEYVNFPEYTYDYAIQKYLPELKKRMNIKEDN